MVARWGQASQVWSLSTRLEGSVVPLFRVNQESGVSVTPHFLRLVASVANAVARDRQASVSLSRVYSSKGRSRVNGAMQFLNSLGLMALLAILYGSLLRRLISESLRNLVIGILFGGAAAMAVFQPVYLGSGVLVDARNLIVGCAAAFFGPVDA